MSGSAVSGVAVLGSTLAPEMRKRGYSKEMSLGPILGSGCLAMIIPPSVLAVLLGSLAQIPVGDLLISGDHSRAAAGGSLRHLHHPARAV